MKRIPTELDDVWLLEPRGFADPRGFFMETYNQREFARLGIHTPFVQDNHSLSQRGVLRGLHYQIRHAQAKLVRVIAGEVFDVAADIRRGSPTFGRWTGHVLSAENRRMLFIPEGFAHGFLVLSDTAEFTYKCSDFYSPADERGILWSDPQLAIAWPIPAGAEAVLSPKDLAYGTLATRPTHDLPEYVRPKPCAS